MTVPAHTALYLGFEGSYFGVRYQSFLDANNLTAQDLARLNLNSFLSFEPINAALEIDGTVVPIDTSASSPYLNSGYVSGVPVPADSSLRDFFYPGREVPDQLAYIFIAEISVLVKPLSVGEHTIAIRVFDGFYGYPLSELQAVDWHITVTP